LDNNKRGYNSKATMTNSNAMLKLVKIKAQPYRLLLTNLGTLVILKKRRV
jgi:hypothetical protein